MLLTRPFCSLMFLVRNFVCRPDDVVSHSLSGVSSSRIFGERSGCEGCAGRGGADTMMGSRRL